jgi:hypothetical protein
MRAATVPNVLATVATQLAGVGGEVDMPVELAGEPDEAALAERAALCVAVADPQPASSPRVRSRDRSRQRRRLLSRIKEALPGNVTSHRLGLCG